MRTLPLFLAALLSAAALAGCTGGDDETGPTPTTTPTTADDPFATPPVSATPGATPAPTTSPTTPAALDSTTYALTSVGAPTQAKPNATIGFTLFVNGTLTSASEHIGAHYANNDTTSPPAAGRSDCPHQGGSFPGEYEVSCTFPTTGTWHVFGHAQVNDSGNLLNWWAQPFALRVRDYNLTLADVPTTAADETNFSFTLNVAALGASDNATSDHIGAHYFNNTTDTSSVTAAGACEHAAGGVVGPHTVTCNVDAGEGISRDVWVRGHVRINDNGTLLSWWSQPYKVTVSPVGGIGLPGFP